MIAAARSLATYLIVSLYVLVAAPIGMLLAVLFRWKNLLYILGHGGVKLGLGLSGIKFRVLGAEHIPAYRAAVYCSNHQSHIDPPVLFHALHPQMHILYKAEIDRIPLLARAFRLGGFIPVDRRNKEAGMRAIDSAAASLRSGSSFLVFPEGTRTPDGAVHPLRAGIQLLIQRAQAPIVPVGIAGAFEAWPRWSPLPIPAPLFMGAKAGTLAVAVGRPLEAKRFLEMSREQVLLELHAELKQVQERADRLRRR